MSETWPCSEHVLIPNQYRLFTSLNQGNEGACLSDLRCLIDNHNLEIDFPKDSEPGASTSGEYDLGRLYTVLGEFDRPAILVHVVDGVILERFVDFSAVCGDA